MREDWVECKIGDITSIYPGIGFPKNLQGKKKGEYPFYKVGDISKNFLNSSRYLIDCDNYVGPGDFEKIENKLVPKNAIVFAKIGEGLKLNRRGIVITESLIDNNTIALKAKGNLDDLYLYHYMNTVKLEKYSQATTVPSVRKSDIESISIPLPPLPEQRAIVKKIETLFSSLDNGIADLKKAHQQLKIFRQAVLKKAFEGIKDKQKVSDIAFVETGATPKRGNLRYWKNGTVPWITSGALNNEFVKDYSEQITETAIKETNCKIIPQGALLIAMYGEGKTRGKCSELTFDTTTNQAVAAIILKEEFKSSKPFLKWFFIKNYNDIRLLSSGGVQPNLNLSIIKNTEIPLPSLVEQHQIVKEIESRLSVCDAVEAQIKESLEKAVALRQSILKKAFEGKLLTAEEVQFCKQEPGYEPASVLLERIKAEQKVKSNAKK